MLHTTALPANEAFGNQFRAAEILEPRVSAPATPSHAMDYTVFVIQLQQARDRAAGQLVDEPSPSARSPWKISPRHTRSSPFQLALQFERSLKRDPNRFRSIYGAGRITDVGRSGSGRGLLHQASGGDGRSGQYAPRIDPGTSLPWEAIVLKNGNQAGSASISHRVPLQRIR